LRIIEKKTACEDIAAWSAPPRHLFPTRDPSRDSLKALPLFYFYRGGVLRLVCIVGAVVKKGKLRPPFFRAAFFLFSMAPRA
jgi:hypothetical protein